MADKVLDAKGLNCPLPILKAKKALKDMTAGQILQVLSTDPGSVADFQAFSRTTGNELVSHNEEGGVYDFLIRKTLCTKAAMATVEKAMEVSGGLGGLIVDTRPIPLELPDGGEARRSAIEAWEAPVWAASDR